MPIARTCRVRVRSSRVVITCGYGCSKNSPATRKPASKAERRFGRRRISRVRSTSPTDQVVHRSTRSAICSAWIRRELGRSRRPVSTNCAPPASTSTSCSRRCEARYRCARSRCHRARQRIRVLLHRPCRTYRAVRLVSEALVLTVVIVSNVLQLVCWLGYTWPDVRRARRRRHTSSIARTIVRTTVPYPPELRPAPTTRVLRAR